MADELKQEIDSLLGPGVPDPSIVPDKAPGVPEDPLKLWIDQAVPAPKQATPAPAPKQIAPTEKVPKAPDNLFSEIDTVTGSPERFASPEKLTPPDSGMVPVLDEGEPKTPETRPGYIEAPLRGMSRGVDMLRSAVPTLQGVYSEWTGDIEAAAQYAAEAKAIDDAAYKPIVGGFSNIKNAEDALYWMLETQGEMTPILAAVMIGGYVGGRAGSSMMAPALLYTAVRAGLMSPQAATAWGSTIGSVLGGALVSVPLETADTAGELREVTGSFHPELSLGSGLVKGVLELYTPLGILNRITGKAAGKSITGAVVGTALKEGVTEALQEEVNIAARKYVDPKYSYFGEEALYRRLDSFAAGALMGGVVGGPTEELGRRVAPKQDTEQSVDDAFAPQSPVSALKRVLPFLQTQRDQELLTVFRANPKLDPLEVNVLLDTFGKDWAGSGIRLNNEEAFYDWMEGQTTRYAVVDEMGKTTELLNPTDLERALTKFPARESLAGRVVEVDQKLLTPAGITASITDLIQADVMKRVYFLPSVDAGTKKQLMTEFQALVNSTEFKHDVLDHMFAPNERVKAAYGAFLDKGMRVLPTAGASYTYSGEFTGKLVAKVPKTGRSIAAIRPNKTLGSTVLHPVSGTLKQLRAFGIDTNKLQPGDAISDRPSEWIWPASLDAKDRQEQSAEFSALLKQYGKDSSAVIERLQELMDMGVHVDATNEVETLVLNQKVLVEQKMVPTSQTNAEGLAQANVFARVFGQRQFVNKVAKVEVAVQLSPELKRAVHDMEKILEAVHPVFKKHALPGVERVALHIKPEINAHVNPSGQIMLVYPADMPYEQAMYVFIHELGHAVTLAAFSKLPTEQIERVYQAYRRNVLADSLTNATLAPNMENTAWRQQRFEKQDNIYAYSFVEYLAEQFGRWMFSRGLPTNSTDGVFKEISSILREVTEGIITWNMSLGDTVDARQRLMPDYTFGRMMDILFELEEETTMAQRSFLGGNIQKIEELARAANDNPERGKGYGIPQFLATYMKPDEGQSVVLERAYEIYRAEQEDPANSIPYPQFRNEIGNTGVLIQRIAGFDRLIGWRKATYAEREEAKAAQSAGSSLRQNTLEVAAAVRQGFSIRDAIRVVIDRVKGMLNSSPADGDVLALRLGQLQQMELQSVNDNLTESPVYDNVVSMRDEAEFKAQRLEVPSPFRNEARQRSLLDEFYDLYQENPVFDDFEDAFAEAKQAIAPMLPKGWTIEAGAPGSGNDAVANTKTKTIVLGLGALRLGVGATLVHETIHALRAEGLFTPEEWKALVREIRQDAALWGAVRAQYAAELTRKAEKLARTIENPGENFVRDWVQDKLEEEAVAFATSIRFAGGNIGPVSNGLIDRIIAFLRAVKERLIGKGYISPGDVRRRIFSGQVAGRLEQDAKFARWTKREQEFAALTMPTSERTERVAIMPNPEIVQLDSDLFIAIKEMGNSAYVRMYFPPEQPFSANMSNNAKLMALGDLIGVVDLQKNKKGWEVDWVKVNKKSYERYSDRRRHAKFSDQVYGYLSERLGFQFQPSATLTKKGYDAWKFRDPQSVRYHVWVDAEGYYHSPNYIREKVLYWKSQLSSPYEETAAKAKDELRQWQAAYRKVPREAWSDPELDRMFARTLTTGMFEAMRLQEQANAERFVTGVPSPPSGFDQVRMQKIEESKLENARSLGIDPALAMPEQPELMAMRGLTRWKGLTPQERRALTGLTHEADRITGWSKRWWGIQQLMWANKHFTAGQKYVQTIEMWTALRARWVEKADTVARKWDRLKPNGQKEALAKTLFYMTEMQYLTPQERRQKVIRQPTQQETAAAFTQFGLNADGQALFAEVNATFSDFLTEFEQIAQKSLRREFVGNPAGLQKAQVELASDIAAMRAKPYFPLSRFGQWTLTVRDSNNQKVEAFYTFASEAERNRYILIARQQYPMSDLRVSKLPTAMQDYVQLPGPVLKRIKATMPGISPQQKTWLDQLEHQTAPERSFRKHWMTREGTPGYSLDAMRAFSTYLNTGAGYLARLAYKDEAQDVITAATADAKLNFGESQKRFNMISEMQEHLNYMLEPGRDGSKLRSFAAMWFLGFSPAAAAMNLTQIPVFTVPYLSSLFEGSAVKRALTAAHTALKGTIAAQMHNPPSPGYEKARQELIAMGKIDAGQAPELGVYASTDNLARSAAGEKAQRHWRNFTKASMWMFGKTERFNRELTFAMTFQLAMDAQNSGKQNKYLAELFTNNSLEILDLMSRTGMTQEEAVATIAAKEAIDRTQFTFAPWARPKFMRGNPVASDLLVFFGYIQSSLYAMRHNPGRIKTLLTMFALYGMMGLPFAADIDKVVEALARQLFGKDWSPQQEARELIVMLTKESAFEKVGADLFLHGISRFGFGPGLLPEGWGAPRFDASANGSMGNIIPVVPDMIKSWGHYGKWKEMVGDAAQKGAGAGYGYMFSLLQFLSSDPHTANWKKWEAIMPRAMKAASKGTRYAAYGEEKSRSGAVIAQFDPRDPDDLSTIVTQVLGFSPQKLTVHYEALQQKKESEMFYKGWRMSLYVQLNEAIQGGEQPVINDVLAGIAKYNAEVVRQDLSPMQINTRQAISSLKGRARGRVLEEQGLPVTKGAIPLYRRIDESYPLLERKIVK
ncbi:MAG: PLxRFG domain-containing protein [Dokdonella sp.]|uniref:PLxRFG domain-containing protein n=1 Tax=Dokdonella sp. TaxID=2291710 RepID=UPI0025C49E78|nr:PLxRFG domain-containing protein [Dokdonella sp.]MBK8123890.1 PLxRFG domain-containing protein [Dokdonella sp.]